MKSVRQADGRAGDERMAELLGIQPVPGPPRVAADDMRAVMSRFATGVVLLSVGGEHVHGMTANAFCSVSLQPPMVLCCVARKALMHNAITSAGCFATSIMESGQQALARHFSDRSRPLGERQFDSVDWVPGPRTGAPVLSGALAWLECELTAAHESGDHSIFVGTVLSAGQGTGSRGLLFFDSAYHEVTPRDR
jgi:flavin reductase